MKIIRFETKNHPILGSCSLDFSSRGFFPDFVLIAGSNGSGKTTILNEIFDCLSNIYPRDQVYDLFITLLLEKQEIDLLKSIEPSIDHILKIESLRKSAQTGINWGQIRTSNSTTEIDHSFASGEIFQGLLKVVYSTVEINFVSSQVKSATAKNIDSEKSPKEKSDANISQEITQLLVDIKTLDNQDAADWIDSNNGKQIQVVLQEKRISRFKKAFDSMIEGKTFQGVKNENDKKKVYFKDSFGNEIDISSLSSGEKQIVFRAGYLLKNMGSLSGGIILIDEPEISLHPSWQEKYVQFIRHIFSNEENVIQSQIIIATHSPFIVQNENISDERIIILEKNRENVIESIWPKFYGYKKPELTFLTSAPTTNPLLLVEGKGDKQILSVAWKKLFLEEKMPFDISWANEPSRGGASLLQKHLIVLSQHKKDKVLGLFDADTRGLNDYKGTKIKNGVEDFLINENLQNLKVLGKVGATYLPICPGREMYFNADPRFSILVLEMYFNDDTLKTLNIIDSERTTIGDKEIIRIKEGHTMDDENLNKLDVKEFELFRALFDHVKKCFDNIP
jgi:predicted ATP-binding protein involved in virulence